MRILYVSHRVAPCPGGTEVFMTALADETAARGHEVAVFTGEGLSRPGVRVTFDPAVLQEPWDAIVVHATDGRPQCTALTFASRLSSPILYLLIWPQVHAGLTPQALHAVRWIGVSTQADARYLSQFPPHIQAKARSVRHSVSTSSSVVGTRGRFRSRFNIQTRFMFLSCGGFWAHKGMQELADTFKALQLPDTTLVLTGYKADRQHMPADASAVRVLVLEDKQDVADAMTDADLYIMNSTHEGFGLVLIEAMMNRLPWIARAIAGAVEMAEHGRTYVDQEGLRELMRDHEALKQNAEGAFQYAVKHRSTTNTVDDILACISGKNYVPPV